MLTPGDNLALAAGIGEALVVLDCKSQNPHGRSSFALKADLVTQSTGRWAYGASERKAPLYLVVDQIQEKPCCRFTSIVNRLPLLLGPRFALSTLLAW